MREVPLAFPAPHHSAREGCPGHCGTLFYGTDFEHIDVLPLENTGARATMVELRVTPSKLVPFEHHLFPTSKVCVPRANRRPLRLSSSMSKKCVRQRLPVLLLHTEPEQRTPDYGICEKQLAGEKSKVVASNVDRLLPSISLLAKTIVLRSYRMMCHRVRHRPLSECAQSSQKYHSDLLHSRILKFSQYVLVFGATHLESIVVASDETSMWMSTASMVSAVRERFHASKRDVHTIIVL